MNGPINCLLTGCNLSGLANTGGNFFDFLNPGNLLNGSLVMATSIAIVVSSIYVILLRKKRFHFYTTSIRRDIENWIADVLLEEDGADIQLPDSFYRLLRNPVARQYVINELIQCKRNFSGDAGDKLVALYVNLGLKKESLKKSRKRQWYIKARGIQELYMMDQKDMLTSIYKNTNNQNEFVRMEAQTGVIYMTGFAGLRFLDVISYPLTEWQQIKLLEQLRLTSKKEDISDQIPAWLSSSNDTVVSFVLKLIDEYQYFNMRNEVIGCLVHRSEKVRVQAVKTLIRLADPSTANILLGYFRKENAANRALILDGLMSIATDEQQEILTGLLDEPDNIVKLKSAMVLANCCSEGMAILTKRAEAEPEPYERILLHVKSAQ